MYLIYCVVGIPIHLIHERTSSRYWVQKVFIVRHY